MKKNLLALFAVVIAIAMSSFTTKPFLTDVYMIYGGGTEKAFGSYTQQTGFPGTQPNVEPLTLVWVKFIDNNGTVLSSEFNTEFEAVDGDFGGTDNDLVSDEIEDGTTIEKQ